MTESESTSKPAKHKQPQLQAKQQGHQKSQQGSEAKQPQAQLQGKLKQLQSAKGNQSQAKQQGNQKSQQGSKAKQSQAQLQGKPKQQQSAKGNQQQAKQQGNQKSQQGTKTKQPQAQQQAKQKQQQSSKCNQPQAQHQDKQKQQQSSKCNQPQAQHQDKQKQQKGSTAKQPQAQQQGKQKSQQGAKAKQPQAQQQGKQKQQKGSTTKQPQAQQQGKQKSQQGAKAKQPQAQQQGKQKQQKGSTTKQLQAQQQGKQKSQQGAKGNQSQYQYQFKHRQQRDTQVNKTKKIKYTKGPYQMLSEYSRGIGIYRPTKGGLHFLDNMILTEDCIEAFEFMRREFDAIMWRFVKDMKLFKNGGMLYEELIHKLFQEKNCVSQMDKWLKFYTPSKASRFEVLTCIARVKNPIVDRQLYGFVATGNFALFMPFIKPGRPVKASLVEQVMRDLLREAFIKNDKTLEDEHVHLDFYILYLNTDFITPSAYELLKQLRAKGVQVITRSKMILSHNWKEYNSQCFDESKSNRRKASQTGCFDLRKLLGTR